MLENAAKNVVPILPWQKHQWQTLRRQIDGGTFTHALLINGLKGIGKLQFALALRDFLLCERPAEFACGECKSCVLLRAQTHADFITLQPEEEGKAIRVDQVRELAQFVSQTAQRNGRKIVLLNPADALNMNAANALLKSLEEPTADTHFLLLCAEPKRLPATVRSRCQMLSLVAPAPELAVSWLSEQLGDHAAAQRRLRLMRNRPCLALQVNDDELQAQAAVYAGVLAVAQSHTAMPTVAEQWSKLPLRSVLECLANLLVDAARLAFAPNMRGQLDADERASLDWVSQHIPLATLFAVYTSTQTMLKKLHHGSNPNKQLAIEGILLEFHTPQLP